MPEPKVPVWDNQADHEVYVPVSEAETGIQAGRYTRQGNTTVTTTATGGTPIVRPPSEAADVIGEGREAENAGAGLEAQHGVAVQARLHQFDGILDGAKVLADSFIDAASLGLIHEHGEQAELRRQEHPGAEFLGSSAAFVATAGMGAEAKAGRGLLDVAKSITPLGAAERGLGVVARGVVPEATTKAGRLLTSGAREAITNAGLIAAYDVGHQASDALVEDKPFSGEHVAAQIPLGLLLGGSFGVAGEYINRLADNEATLKALRDQGGVVNPKSTLSSQVHDEVNKAVGEWDRVVQERSTQAAIVRKLVDSGSLDGVPAQYLDRLKASQNAAERARAALDKIDLSGVMARGDAKEMAKAAQAVSAYEAAAGAFDHALAPSMGELGLTSPARSDLQLVPGRSDFVHNPTGVGGGIDAAGAQLDAHMAADPELQARYKEIYGQDYEFLSGLPSESNLEGAENLGGQVTPTSENKTGVGRRRQTPVEEVTPPQGVEALQDSAIPEQPAAVVPGQFHGAAQDIGSWSEGYYSGRNIYGEGFYTTDNLQIAQSYTGKNRRGAAPGAGPVVYRVSEITPVKFYNLDAGISPGFKAAFQEQADHLTSFEGVLDDIETGRIKTATEAMDAVRRASWSDGEAADAITAAFDNIKERLQKEGYGGFEHEGGKLAGRGEVAHQVKIYWEPETQLKLDKVSRGAKTVERVEGPKPPPAIVEKLEGGKKARLEDGSVVWRSEHRKMVKDYERQLAEFEKAKPQGPTTKVMAGREGRGDLDALNQAVEKLPPPPHTPTKQILESPGSIRKTLPEANPLGKQVGDENAIQAALEKDRGPAAPGEQHGPIPPLKQPKSEPFARKYLEDLAKQHGPGVPPGQLAAAKIQRHLERIEQATGGRLTGARALEVAEALGVKSQGRTQLADKMVQIWTIRRLAETATQAAKGEAKGASKLVRRLAAHGMAAVGLKHAGPIGFAVGHALGWAANVGSVAGRAKQLVRSTAEALLKNQRSRMMARAFTKASDRNPDDEHYGHQVETLRQRAELIARAAGDEQNTRERIRESLGHLSEVQPDVAKQIEDSTVQRLHNLSLRLPMFAARSGHVGVQDQRRFEEYEDATWHPEKILDAIHKGDLTPTLAKALADQHPELQRVLTEELLADPETIKTLPNRLLRQVEMITGMPLTRSSDPGFILRQQMSPPTQSQQQQPSPQGGSQPQRFKMTAPPPMPSEAAGLSGRAPGN